MRFLRKKWPLSLNVKSSKDKKRGCFVKYIKNKYTKLYTGWVKNIAKIILLFCLYIQNAIHWHKFLTVLTFLVNSYWHEMFRLIINQIIEVIEKSFRLLLSSHNLTLQCLCFNSVSFYQTNDSVFILECETQSCWFSAYFVFLTRKIDGYESYQFNN